MYQMNANGFVRIHKTTAKKRFFENEPFTMCQNLIPGVLSENDTLVSIEVIKNWKDKALMLSPHGAWSNSKIWKGSVNETAWELMYNEWCFKNPKFKKSESRRPKYFIKKSEEKTLRDIHKPQIHNTMNTITEKIVEEVNMVKSNREVKKPMVTIRNFPYEMPKSLEEKGISFGTVKLLMELFNRDAIRFESDDDQHNQIVEELQEFEKNGLIHVLGNHDNLIITNKNIPTVKI